MRFLKGIAIIIGSLFLIGIFFNLNEQDHKPSTAFSEPKQPISSARNCKQGAPVPGTYYVGHNDINFRVGPGMEQAFVINRKASDILGETLYRTLSISMVLEGRCETDEWLKVQIVKADGNTVNWETGWVQKKYVTGEASDNIKAGLLWDVDSESDFSVAEKQVVKRGALKVLDDEANCAEIITGYRSSSRNGAYYVTCNARNSGPPFNVWFTPDEVNSGSSLTVPNANPEAQSRQACEQAIQASVTYPSTLDIHHFLGYATEVHNNGNRTVIQEFTEINDLGIELKYRARCLIQPNGDVEIAITSFQ